MLPFFNRIGLRYIDVVDRKALGLEDCSWADLIRSSMLGMLVINDGEGIEAVQNSQLTELSLDEALSMVIRTGLGSLEGQTDQVFVIDTDTFISRDVSLEEATALLDSLHDPVSRYFRWAITDKLHNAMNPQPLEG